MNDVPVGSFGQLDAQTLTNLLTDPRQSSETHRQACNALANIKPDERRSRLIDVMQTMVSEAGKYDTDVMMSVVDLLGTDPHPDATVAMVQVLPDILTTAVEHPDALPAPFRQYFYSALMTRFREDDLAAWARLLPQLKAKTLVAALLDPVGAPLAAIEPLTLISRLGEPERTRALISAIAGLARYETGRPVIDEAGMLLTESSDRRQLEHGVGLLEERWRGAKRAGREVEADNLEAALALIDTRPRSASERLMGRRPWAS
jgi:hypothetical protein